MGHDNKVGIDQDTTRINFLIQLYISLIDPIVNTWIH
jgi:hypothetical protein